MVYQLSGSAHRALKRPPRLDRLLAARRGAAGCDCIALRNVPVHLLLVRRDGDSDEPSTVD
jgi:hypothetical protein